MTIWFLPSTRAGWDCTFLLSLPVLVLAAAGGLWWGGPWDNLIVALWLLPLWLLARYRIPAARPRQQGAD